MTDLGFGLVDRRSVMIILFTFVLSFALFKNTVPVDTSTPTAAFISLVILTGFIYCIRSICRVLLVMGYVILRLPLILFYTILSSRQNSESSEKGAIFFLHALSETFAENFWSPLFQDRDWHPIIPELVYSDGRPFIPGQAIEAPFPSGPAHPSVPDFVKRLGLIDRAMLVLITFVSTLPPLATYRESLGLLGIGTLVVVYVLTGRFTFILKNAFHKSEEEKYELLAATKKSPRTVYTKPAPPDYPNYE